MILFCVGFVAGVGAGILAAIVTLLVLAEREREEKRK